jgi:hypothetical protein
MNTRTIAIVALVIAVVIVVIPARSLITLPVAVSEE